MVTQKSHRYKTVTQNSSGEGNQMTSLHSQQLTALLNKFEWQSPWHFDSILQQRSSEGAESRVAVQVNEDVLEIELGGISGGFSTGIADVPLQEKKHELKEIHRGPVCEPTSV